MLLNTDWSRAGNAKKVTVVIPKMSFECEVVERQAKIFTILPDAVVEAPAEIHVEVIDRSHVKLFGSGTPEIIIRHKSGVIENYRVHFKETTETTLAI